jgi:hypothetical protein
MLSVKRTQFTHRVKSSPSGVSIVPSPNACVDVPNGAGHSRRFGRQEKCARFGYIRGTPTREMRCRQRFRASLVSTGRFAIVKVLSLSPVALYGTQT